MSIMSTGTGRLAGKSIVIVGGSSGMGLSAALACAAEGAQLVLVGRDADKCQRAVDQVGSQACHQVGDAADPDVVSRAVELAVQAGDDLIVTREESGWLWCTNRRGASGWVPAAAVALRPRDGWQEKEES